MTGMIVEGEEPSAEQVFYHQWALTTLKDNIATLNSTFRLFITIETALLAAYLGFYDKIALSPSWLKAIPGVLFTISFITSIVGIYPFAVRVDASEPENIRAYKQGRAEFKGRCLRLALATLIMGFIFLLLARIVT